MGDRVQLGKNRIVAELVPGVRLEVEMNDHSNKPYLISNSVGQAVFLIPFAKKRSSRTSH